ncbi:MAG: MFS transporter [Gammaproteobacteria bacterium]|nr:MFS transporter [Gammaproteobacteria bacterium]
MNKNVWLLTACQSLMMTNNALLLTASALVGAMLADNVALATLPLALQFFATMLASIPASLIMKQHGRRYGFMLGTVIGMLGAVIATVAIYRADFWLFCLGTMLVGVFNGFGGYYRFAAVDAVSEDFRSRAISYVMAGGVIAAVIGPNIVGWTHDAISGIKFAGSYIAILILYIMSFTILSFVQITKLQPEQNELAASRPLTVVIRQPLFVIALISAMFGYAVMSLVMTATPLSMHHHHHSLSDTVFVIQWHVLGMFAPSFFTGKLISRYGVINIMLAGVVFLLLAVTGNLLGTTLWYYWVALFLLGVGWNFLYIGATDLLTYTYSEGEKAKAQAFNDFFVYGSVTIAALTAGYLQYTFGWRVVNLGVLPLIVSILMALVWLKLSKQEPVLVTG